MVINHNIFVLIRQQLKPVAPVKLVFILLATISKRSLNPQKSVLKQYLMRLVCVKHPNFP